MNLFFVDSFKRKQAEKPDNQRLACQLEGWLVDFQDHRGVLSVTERSRAVSESSVIFASFQSKGTRLRLLKTAINSHYHDTI